MTRKTIVVEEIEGSDVDLNSTTVVAERIEAPPVVMAKPRDRMEGWPEILLEDNPDIPPVGQFFGLNGDTYLLRPGVRARVPPGIVEILNNATMTTPVKDPNTLQPVGWRDRLRYPYRLLRSA